MNLKPLLILSSTALAIVTSTAFAQPFNSFDPRSMAMGGVGVAIADPATAPFFNPAMLAIARDEQDFSLELPIIGARAYDPGEMEDTLDRLQNSSILALEQAITDNNAALTPTSLRNVASSLTAVNNDMVALGQEKLQVELGAAMVISIPSDTLAMAVSASSWNVVGAQLDYTDSALVTALATEINDCADALDLLPNTCIAGTYVDTTTGNITFDPNTQLTSGVAARGVQLNEIGVSVASKFDVLGIVGLAVGVTPKMVEATVYDYSANINTADTANFDDVVTKQNGFNMDVGVGIKLPLGFRAGLVAKNVKSEEYETVANNIIETKAQLRAGVSHQTDWTTVALDVDLTENEAISFEDESQQVAIGAEFSVLNSVKLRAGYRGDTVNTDRGILSAGVGFNLLGAHIDLAYAKSDDEVGASMQLGFAF